MKTLIKNIMVTYPGHPLHNQRVDLSIDQGVVAAVGTSLKAPEGSRTIDGSTMLCLPALFDMQCSIGEPGMEEKETLMSAAKCAAAGGYSDIVMLPNTKPVIDHKALVEFVSRESDRLPARIHTYGSISKKAAGSELSEMYDMHRSGAVAFSDGKLPISDVNLMKRALEYARNFNGLVCSFPVDERVNPGGMVNESLNNTRLGLKAMPAIAEELMLNRDLYLLQYTGSKMHVSTVSTEGSVRLLRDAKERSLNVTSGVALANLVFDDTALNDFDTRYKTTPPLRDSSDVLALRRAVMDGTIDVIVSDHTPENIENKDVEFDHASYGMTMLETSLSLVNMHLAAEMGWDALVRAMSIRPRTILGLPLPKLEEGSMFECILFDVQQEWTYSADSCMSLSHNSPVFGKALKGKVVTIQ